MILGQKNRSVGSSDWYCINDHRIPFRGENKIDQSTCFGKLHLIDLARSLFSNKFNG